MTSPSSSFARRVNLLYICIKLIVFFELSSEIFHAVSHYCKAIKLNVVLVTASNPLACASIGGS